MHPNPRLAAALASARCTGLAARDATFVPTRTRGARTLPGIMAMLSILPSLLLIIGLVLRG